ncbi:MAG: hypothetical protein U9R44_03680 [Candidatus Omnitrophota bacterium]|nr:hypothetical protein [Candidatus Omnitrophota bacterium]
MKRLFNIQSLWFKVVATGAVCLFVLNDFSFALQPVEIRNSDHTLSPVSRFATVVRIEDQDGRSLLVEDEPGKSNLTRDFQEGAAFIYLNRLICRVLELFGSKISAEGLKEIIRENISHTDFTRFDLEELYKEGDTFYLPYKEDDGRTQILRYYLPAGKPAEFPGKPSIPVGTGTARESGEGASFSTPQDREQFDRRPVDASLLHEAYVKHDMAVKSIVNPDNKPLVAVYGAAGGDISNFLLSTNATEAYFISEYSWRFTRLSPKDLKKCFESKDPDKYIDRYLRRDLYFEKFYTGFTNKAALDEKRKNVAAIAYELKAMGVDLKKVRVEAVRAGRFRRYPKITFSWKYKNAQKQDYSIVFIDADITKPEQYKEILNGKSIDLYYQKAGNKIALDYNKAENSFIRVINNYLKPGGYFITDDYIFHPEKVSYTDNGPWFPLPLSESKIPGIESFEREISEIRSADYCPEGYPGRREAFSYGWNVRLRQKPLSFAPVEPPAIALVKGRGKWAQYALNPDQHEIINATWRILWNKGYGLPEDDEIVSEITGILDEKGVKGDLPVHIHSPPQKVFLDTLYELARNMNVYFPPRGQFRLITHPGTYRDRETGRPRSCNMLVPREEFTFLKELRQEDPESYWEWLDHEVAHLADRAKGGKKTEKQLTREYPIEKFLGAVSVEGKEAAEKNPGIQKKPARVIGEKKILRVFKKGNVRWGQVTKEAKLLMVKKLAKALKKEPGALNTADFQRKIPRFNNKSLGGFLFWAEREFNVTIGIAEALSRLKTHLGITDLLEPVLVSSEPSPEFIPPHEETKGASGSGQAGRRETAVSDEPESPDIPDLEKKAQDFIDAVIIPAYKARTKKQGEKIVIGIDTSWIPDIQQAAIQRLVNGLSLLSERKGFDNVIVKRGKGIKLADELLKLDEIAKNKIPLSNIVILGDRKVLNSKAFDPLRNPDAEKDGAFFAEIALPEGFPENSYIRLLEMLTIAVQLAFGGKAPPDDPFIKIIQDGPRVFLFIPKPEPFEFEELKKIYENQKQVIRAA